MLRLHEFLCFLRAYPDNQAVLDQTSGCWRASSAAPTSGAIAAALADTGIAGTAIHYVFFWFTAQWLARRWPDRLSIDWKAFDRKSREEVERLLHLILPYAETPTIDAVDLPLRSCSLRS